MNIQQIIKQHHLELLFQQGSFGIEKESQRVHADGSIVTSLHPKAFGNRRFHPYIQTDFAESQLELVTPPMKKLEDTLRWLSAIHEVTLRLCVYYRRMNLFSHSVCLQGYRKKSKLRLHN